MERRRRLMCCAAGAILAVALLAVPASASVSVSGVTASISGWVLAAEGSNTLAAGSITVEATEAYTLSVTADVTRMTEYDPGAGAYVAGGKTLGQALQVVAVRSGGTALVPGVGATATIGSVTTLATGTGPGSDVYDLTLSQTTALTDRALPDGRTYRIVLTYTASATL